MPPKLRSTKRDGVAKDGGEAALGTSKKQRGITENTINPSSIDAAPVLEKDITVVADAGGDEVERKTDSETPNSVKPGATGTADVEMFNYDLPFTIFDRFIPSTPWNMDSKQSPTQNILFTSGERRKKEVKDDFEWLHPTT